VPQVIIIAGPNGAGKTTFAREYLSTEGLRFQFVNADEIARLLAVELEAPEHSDIRAGRIMLQRLDELVEGGADFAFETTLATLVYARKIPIWRKRGYQVSLIYLHLSSVIESIARVRKRVEAGGHNIPEETIKRRFVKSVEYFETIYKPIVDAWYIRESSEGTFLPVESSESGWTKN
jgi:predicted ABC-type ATPase